MLYYRSEEDECVEPTACGHLGKACSIFMLVYAFKKTYEYFRFKGFSHVYCTFVHIHLHLSLINKLFLSHRWHTLFPN